MDHAGRRSHGRCNAVRVDADLQNVAGKHLDAGTAFAQVLDLSSAIVQISIPERDTMLMRAGETHEILHPRPVPGDGDCGCLRGVVAGPSATSCAGSSIQPKGMAVYHRRSRWMAQVSSPPQIRPSRDAGFFLRGRVNWGA